MSKATQCNVHQIGRLDGPILLFVHGYGCDQHMWRHVTPPFEADYRIVLLDLIGSGGSDLTAYDPQRYATLHGYADDLVQLGHELDLRDATIVGHSVSAMIGALAATQAPDLFTRLAMVGPSPCYINDGDYHGGFEASDIDELIAAIDANYLGWSTNMAPIIMGRPDRPELGNELSESFCRTDPTIARQFARVTFMSDHRADLPAVTAPTLVLQCTDDIIAPVEVGRYIERVMPNATMVLLEATGHCPHLSEPGETTAAIAAFLHSSR